MVLSTSNLVFYDKFLVKIWRFVGVDIWWYGLLSSDKRNHLSLNTDMTSTENLSFCKWHVFVLFLYILNHFCKLVRNGWTILLLICLLTACLQVINLYLVLPWQMKVLRTSYLWSSTCKVQTVSNNCWLQTL